MTLSIWAISLYALGAALLLAEALLPTHGVLGVLALLSFLGGVGVCYAVDPVLGTGVLLASAVAAPFVLAGFVKLWPKTPVGRRIMLGPGSAPGRVAPPVEGDPAALAVGRVGVAITQLRPVGECEFDAPVGRCEAISELGMIEPGRRVKVVAVVGSRPTVRAV